MQAATDIPRLLDAAVKLRSMCEFACELADDDVNWAVVNTLLAETAFLADSPEAPLSPDGENKEGSEHD